MPKNDFSKVYSDVVKEIRWLLELCNVKDAHYKIQRRNEVQIVVFSESPDFQYIMISAKLGDK